ncbi:uncharacterized oxidoreductase YfjR-like [Penaeus indicus]|uniref:uncharacterized oxidoreductase YfjR-like n=1 Tax=Penaeus indicus TaxID=29960 RepID=UPI00300DB05D
MLGRACSRLSEVVCRSFTRSVATATKDTKVGVVGCGQVGQAVSNNLVNKGFKVVAACDTDRSRLLDLPSSIRHVTTPREVTELADVVVSCLPKPPNVRAASEGPDGILAGISEGKVWIDHSTTEFEQTEFWLFAGEHKSQLFMGYPAVHEKTICVRECTLVHLCKADSPGCREQNHLSESARKNEKQKLYILGTSCELSDPAVDAILEVEVFSRLDKHPCGNSKS